MLDFGIKLEEVGDYIFGNANLNWTPQHFNKSFRRRIYVC